MSLTSLRRRAAAGSAGQGVNSALEDVCVLEQQLADAGGNLAQALPAFEAQRLPDSAALAKLVQVRGEAVSRVACAGAVSPGSASTVMACRVFCMLNMLPRAC